MPNESRKISNLWRVARFKVSPGAPRILHIRRGVTVVVGKQMRDCLLLLAVLILPFGVVPNATHAADTSGERWRISKCFGATQATDQLSTFEHARTYNNRCWILLTLHMPMDLALADCARGGYRSRTSGSLRKSGPHTHEARPIRCGESRHIEVFAADVGFAHGADRSGCLAVANG